MMPTADTLSALVASQQLPEEMERDALMRALGELAGIEADSAAAAVAEDAFLQAVGAGRVELEMRPGGWIVKASSSVTRAAVATALLAGILWLAHVDQIPMYVLPAVLPLVVDVEHSRLNRSDKTVLLRLRANAAHVEGYTVHPDVLYNRLPLEIRDQISPLDFQDFIEKLIENGIANDAGYGDVALRPADHPAWIRITFR